MKFYYLLLFYLVGRIFVNVGVAQDSPCRNIVGYYPNWQWYDRAKLVRPATLHYHKYTHINYAFFKPEADGSISETDSWADDILLLGEYDWSTNPPGRVPNTSIVELAHNANVKILPSIGGWTLSNHFPSIASDASKRANFAHHCINLIKKYKFDGLDIDWEYPGYEPNAGTPQDKQNFTLFLSTLRDSLSALGEQNQTAYLLTIAVGAAPERMQDVAWNDIIPLVDIINLMSYDFFGPWDSHANHNAPLFAPAQGANTFNLASAALRLVNDYNVPAEKICAGVAFYGRSAITNGAPALFAPLSGQVDAATFATDEGAPLYYNIVDKLPLFDYHWDNQAQVPYLLGKNGLNTFVSFDDAKSIAAKANFITDNNLGGAIIWEITGDYLETAPGSGQIAATPLIDTLNYVFCSSLPTQHSPKLSTAQPQYYCYQNYILSKDNFNPTDIQIAVWDLQGRVLERGLWRKHTPHYPLTHLNPGIYYLQLKGLHTLINQKIIIYPK